MAAITNAERLGRVARLNEASESEGLRVAQNALLSELPGIAFALLTLAYVVTSFAGLL